MSLQSILEWLMTPSPALFVLGFLIIGWVPILLHTVLVARAEADQPFVLIAGPSATGKTSLAHLFEYGEHSKTSFISQVPQSVQLTASRDGRFKDSFIANKEDTTGTHTKFLLVDTPGHGKLRNIALEKIASGTGSNAKGALRSVVFFLDAAALGEQEVLADTAGYLYEILLALQKASIKKSRSGARRDACGVPVLVAANKLDLFTALPGTAVKANLEAEITRIRNSKTHGLLDSGVGSDEIGSEERDDWLGEYGSKKFLFSQLSEFNVEVDVIGGNTNGKEGPGVEKWWQWIAYRV